jgi:hypothetical protein
MPDCPPLPTSAAGGGPLSGTFLAGGGWLALFALALLAVGVGVLLIVRSSWSAIGAFALGIVAILLFGAALLPPSPSPSRASAHPCSTPTPTPTKTKTPTRTPAPAVSLQGPAAG